MHATISQDAKSNILTLAVIRPGQYIHQLLNACSP